MRYHIKTVYPVQRKFRRSINLSMFGMGRFRIVGTRAGKHVICGRFNSEIQGILAELGVIVL